MENALRDCRVAQRTLRDSPSCLLVSGCVVRDDGVAPSLELGSLNRDVSSF